MTQMPPPGPPQPAPRPRSRRLPTIVVAVVGGLLVLGLLAFNVLLLADGPSRTARQRAADAHGVPRGVYADVQQQVLAVEDVIGELGRAQQDYWQLMPLDGGAEVINAPVLLTRLDRAVAELDASPARQNPEFESRYTSWRTGYEKWQAGRTAFLAATTEAATTLDGCNPYALPVYAAGVESNREVLEDCVEQLSALEETTDPDLAAVASEAGPGLQQWVDALGGDIGELTAGRDDFLEAFGSRADAAEKTASREQEAVTAGLAELREYADTQTVR